MHMARFQLFTTFTREIGRQNLRRTGAGFELGFRVDQRAPTAHTADCAADGTGSVDARSL